MSSEPSDLASLWSHEPHVELMFRPGDTVAHIDTEATPGFRGDKSDAPTLQAERNVRFAELQEMLYANSRAGDTRSVLLVLQGMDTAGKGGIVKHVVGGGNPQGIQYRSFGKPTEEELSHHYLWRIRKALPAAGHIGVFDRSHYEDVL
ncbi:PPK2 family polyphosphate--nucleotide phosphotransferase, partial [Mycobacterium sp. ITM-2017-0098]